MECSSLANVLVYIYFGAYIHCTIGASNSPCLWTCWTIFHSVDNINILPCLQDDILYRLVWAKKKDDLVSSFYFKNVSQVIWLSGPIELFLVPAID